MVVLRLSKKTTALYVVSIWEAQVFSSLFFLEFLISDNMRAILSALYKVLVVYNYIILIVNKDLSG